MPRLLRLGAPAFAAFNKREMKPLLEARWLTTEYLEKASVDHVRWLLSNLEQLQTRDIESVLQHVPCAADLYACCHCRDSQPPNNVYLNTDLGEVLFKSETLQSATTASVFGCVPNLTTTMTAMACQECANCTNDESELEAIPKALRDALRARIKLAVSSGAHTLVLAPADVALLEPFAAPLTAYLTRPDIGYRVTTITRQPPDPASSWLAISWTWQTALPSSF